jgi:hypothetical protein
MEITQERNVDCAPQRVVTVQGEIGICLKEEVGQFSSLLLGTVLYTSLSSTSRVQLILTVAPERLHFGLDKIHEGA